MRRDLALIVCFAALIAGCSLMPGVRVSGIPVPITLQTFAIMVAAACLGPRRRVEAGGDLLRIHRR
jgi:biotin transport system substrate-specific component